RCAAIRAVQIREALMNPLTPSFCSRCGTSLQADANFCHACGARVHKASATSSESPRPEPPSPPMQVQSEVSAAGEGSYLRDRQKLKTKEKARVWWLLALSFLIAFWLSVVLSTVLHTSLSVSWKPIFGVVGLVDLVWIIFFRKVKPVAKKGFWQ